MNASKFPLTWPVAWKRTPKEQRRRARFVTRTVTASAGPESYTRNTDLTVFQAVGRLQDELRLLGATNEILSTNVETRLDGTPRSDRSAPADPGAACYFALKGKERVLACDRWDRVADNIAAIAAHIDAMRRIERYGVGTLDQAFEGYKALPATAVDWWIILGLPQSATLDQVEEKFRELARRAHPDTGGSHDQMATLTAARTEARKVLA